MVIDQQIYLISHRIFAAAGYTYTLRSYIIILTCAYIYIIYKVESQLLHLHKKTNRK